MFSLSLCQIPYAAITQPLIAHGNHLKNSKSLMGAIFTYIKLYIAYCLTSTHWPAPGLSFTSLNLLPAIVGQYLYQQLHKEITSRIPNPWWMQYMIWRPLNEHSRYF
jgi:hypothetical protein